MKIVGIPTLSDNYTWLIRSANDTKEAWVVDPGEANPVIEYCQSHHLQLAGILITHHHYDHVDGVKDLIIFLVRFRFMEMKTAPIKALLTLSIMAIP